MDKITIILSAPRTGSTAYFYNIRKINEQAGAKIVSTLPWSAGSEFLFVKNSEITLSKRIEFLQKERENGNEWAFKVHYHQLIDWKIIDWFYDFYKNHNIVRITRRNKWKWFLSWHFQECNKWALANINKHDQNKKLSWFNIDERISEMINSTYYRAYDQSIHKFFDMVNMFEQAKCSQTVYYEDIDFTNSNIVKLSDNIQYEDYFFNIEQLKRKFDETAANRYNH